MLEKLGKILESYLNDSKDWKHTHLKSIGEIDMRCPWREDTWYYHKNGWYIVHCQNYRHDPIMSGPTPRHTWRIANGNSKESWRLTLQYGVCSLFDDNKQYELPL